ncbi:zona pellucida sperm-binding protein 3-like [Lissotriton helveticus]
MLLWFLLAVGARWVCGRPGVDLNLDADLGTINALNSTPETTLREVHAGHEDLHGVLILLNNDLSYGRRYQIFQWGFPINIEARVNSASGEALKIYVDECYGAPTADLKTSGKTYAIIHNHGCLVDGKFGNSSFWHRTNNSIIFTIQAFMLMQGAEEQVYIHCSLSVWNPEKPVGLTRKSCSYDLFSSRLGWHLLEDPSLNSLCECCEASCTQQSPPSRGDADSEHGVALYRVVLGPLTVQKKESEWWEERCRSLKRFLLAATAFVGSCLLGALFTGSLLVCARSLGSYCRKRKTEAEIPRSPYPPLQREEKELQVHFNKNDQATVE